MEKVLIVYFSQTGQLREILQSLTGPLAEEYELVTEELKPKVPFPFPWKGPSFFQAFPESVQETGCELEPFAFNPDDDFDLVILGIQVWYLSPSIPVSAFLQSEAGKRVMKGRPVLTVQGVRNMWVMSQERVKQRIMQNGGHLIGNIVLADPHRNLVSVVTIVRWLMKGEKHGGGLYGRLFPPAGVPEPEIRSARRFGKLILDALKHNEINGLQELIRTSGGIRINPLLVEIEKRGFAMFRIWSKFILKKGVYGDPAREGRLKAFKYYLFTVIYIVSPVVSLLFRLKLLATPGKTRKMIAYYSDNALKQ